MKSVRFQMSLTMYFNFDIRRKCLDVLIQTGLNMATLNFDAVLTSIFIIDGTVLALDFDRGRF